MNLHLLAWSFVLLICTYILVLSSRQPSSKACTSTAGRIQPFSLCWNASPWSYRCLEPKSSAPLSSSKGLRNTCRTNVERVKSRFNLARILFEEYAPDELFDILNQSTQYALAPGSYSEHLLQTIACLADGDARISIVIYHILKDIICEKIISFHF